MTDQTSNPTLDDLEKEIIQIMNGSGVATIREALRMSKLAKYLPKKGMDFDKEFAHCIVSAIKSLLREVELEAYKKGYSNGIKKYAKELDNLLGSK